MIPALQPKVVSKAKGPLNHALVPSLILLSFLQLTLQKSLLSR